MVFGRDLISGCRRIRARPGLVENIWKRVFRSAQNLRFPSAKRLGRLTLNPLAHITLFGTIIMPLIAHFGWAKPVPVNFAVLAKKEIFKVAVAGPAANILLAIGLAATFHIFRLGEGSTVGNFVLLTIFLNLVLATFNLLPIPPLDGSKMV